MTTVAIMQPTYLPWMGYFDMLDQADLFILLDTVAVDRQSWQTRNRVLDRSGNEVWLSIPVHARMGQALNTVEIDNSKPWRRKHKSTLGALSRGGPESLLTLYDLEWDYLSNFTEAVLRKLAHILGITTPIVRASREVITTDPVERLTTLLEGVEATEFLNASTSILKTDRLGDIPIRPHQYELQPYPQNGADFVGHMSVVDCLARHGAEETLRIVRSGRVMSSSAPA